MDIAEFKTRLKAGRTEGVYLFAGEEEYLIRYYLGELSRAVGIDEAFAVFNHPVYDGEDVTLSALEEDVKAPPVMADCKLIEWRHADLGAMKEKELDALEALCELVGEHPEAVVAITAPGECVDLGTAKKPSAFAKRFAGRMNILEFPLSTDNQLYAWLKKHFDAEGVDVTLDTLRALVLRSGHSMQVLSSEVEKLAALAHARGLKLVSAREVEEVCSSTPESDTFALSNAITEKDRAGAYAALEELRHRRVDPAVITGMLARVIGEMLSVAMMLDEGKGMKDIETLQRMNPYKLKLYAQAKNKYTTEKLREGLSELVRMDAESKFGGISGYEMVEIFVSKFI